jgi:hypothetical protein
MDRVFSFLSFFFFWGGGGFRLLLVGDPTFFFFILFDFAYCFFISKVFFLLVGIYLFLYCITFFEFFFRGGADHLSI